METNGRLSRREFLVGGALAAGTAVALSAGGLVAAPAGASVKPATKALEKVVFQLGWLKLAQFGGHFVALQNGYFKDEGIDAVFLSGGANIDPLSLVESGQVDMGDGNGSDVLTAVSKGVPVKSFGTIYQSTPNALMAFKKDHLTTLASLKGKTVGLPNGEQQLLQAMFKRAGVDPNDVTLVVVGTDPSVLTSGSVDAYIGYGTEQGLDMQQDGYDVTIVYFDKLGDPDYGNAYFAKSAYLDANADLVKAWMKADLKGWQDFCADPKAAAKLTWDLYHTQTQAVLKSEEASSTVSVPLIDGGDAAVHGLLWVDSKAFTEVYELYRTAGIITAAVDIPDVYTQEFLIAAGDKA